MKPNQIKVKLIKKAGTNILLKGLKKKALLDLDRSMITEKKGFIFKKIERYLVDLKHGYRDEKGKAIFEIDMLTHSSLGYRNEEQILKDKKIESVAHVISKIDGELLNTLTFMVDEKYHEANMKIPKIARWQQIILLFAGMGLFFLITQIIGMIANRF